MVQREGGPHVVARSDQATVALLALFYELYISIIKFIDVALYCRNDLEKTIMALKARCSSVEERLETMHELEAEVKELWQEQQEWSIEREQRDHRIRDLQLKLSISDSKALENEAEDRERQQAMEQKLLEIQKVDQTLAANDTQWQARLAKNETRCTVLCTATPTLSLSHRTDPSHLPACLLILHSRLLE